MRRTHLLSVLLLGVLLAACDNVGRAFDPDVTPPTNNQPTTSTIQVLPAGGDARNGRPIVRATYPDGGGWPSTVPVVVEFSESMNEASLLPTSQTADDAKVVLRISGTTTNVPVVYNFLAAGRVLVLRPLTALGGAQAASFDVVLKPGGRDSDGVRFSATTESVLSTFTIDANATTDATILAVYPRDNQSSIQRDNDFLCVFTRPVNFTSLAGNFFVRTQGGSAVTGTPSQPLSVTNFPETRVVGYRPANSAPWAASTTHEFVVNSSITFGTDGELQFSNRTPYSRFTTGAPPTPTSISVDNLTASFPHKVNLANFATLRLSVAVPADALTGDVVTARVYGGDRNTTATGDLAFVERATTLTTDGTQNAIVDFAGALGLLTRLRFDDGSLSYSAQLVRGSQRSGAALGDSSAAQDTVRPTLTSLGPPSGSNGTDLYTELETLTVFGIASEALGDASFVLNTPAPVTAGLFASRTNGTFLLAPAELGRRSAATGYSLTITDLAGNLAASASTGNVIQRGLVTGSVASGDLVVDAFDATTLRPVVGAEVLVDPGAPTVPPASGRVIGTTDSSGRASFTGLTAGSHTITLVAAGYDLVTFYDTAAGFVSLPLRATAVGSATASLTGTLTFPATVPGASAFVGSNLYDDLATQVVQTTTNAPAAVPTTAVQPNRPMVLTAFGGVFPATTNPSFLVHACNLLSGAVDTPAPPVAPVAAGATQTSTLSLREVGSSFGALVPFAGVDFTSSRGFLAGSLAAAPGVRFAATLDGFSGQATVGIGFPTGSTASLVTANGIFSTAILDGLVDYAPLPWVVVDARDSAGALSRTRAQLDPTTNTASVQVLPQDLHLQDPSAVLTLTSPPLLQLYDAIDVNQVETTTVGVFATGLLGIYDVVGVDSAGRSWRLIANDTDAGTSGPSLRSWQFPAAGTAATVALGAFTVTPAARLFRAGTGSSTDFVLGERFHREVTLTRAPAISYTLQ